MASPVESDYEVRVNKQGVEVTFKPTESLFTFGLLDASLWGKHGPVSSSPNVRHAKSGDTGKYSETEVCDLALKLAQGHALKHATHTYLASHSNEPG
jgi:hypothetical protein